MRKSRLVWAAALLVVGSILLATAGMVIGLKGSSGSPPSADTVPGMQVPKVELTLSFDKLSYQVGDAGVLTLSVKNTGDGQITFTTDSVRLIVYDANMAQLGTWSLSSSRLPTPGPSSRPSPITLNRGEVYTWSFWWPLTMRPAGSFVGQALSTGSYYVVAQTAFTSNVRNLMAPQRAGLLVVASAPVQVRVS